MTLSEDLGIVPGVEVNLSRWGYAQHFIMSTTQYVVLATNAWFSGERSLHVKDMLAAAHDTFSPSTNMTACDAVGPHPRGIMRDRMTVDCMIQ